MTAAAWAAYAIAAAGALGLALWLYARREPPGRGRLLLAVLRGLALALVLLLLFDPPLRRRAAPDAGRAPRVLLDASASMSLPSDPSGSGSRWSSAVAEARRRAGGRNILLFGQEPRPVAVDSLPAEAPGDARSRVLPALQAAAEAGAREVTVITDGGIEDVAVLEGWLARLGLQVHWLGVGEPLPGAGLVEVQAPSWAEAGTPVEIRVVIGSSGGPPGERRLVVRQDGRVIAEMPVQTPPEGRVARAAVAVRPLAPPDGGRVRLDVALEPGDVLEADDRRTIVLHVSPDPAGLVLVSVRPDWEPRFLLPVLERALGIPARGYLQAAPGHWVRLGAGAAAGARVTEGDVARAVSAADLLVVHAPPETPPPWLARALEGAPRLLVLAASAGAGPPLPFAMGAPVPGDWFVAEAIPPSPVAALLAGAPVADVPPLTGLIPAAAPPGTWTALEARAGRGRSDPVLVAREGGGRRWAVALGQGYWRWAFRGGAGRELYERLWSAVGGWLLAESRGPDVAAVRPVEVVVPRGTASAWVAVGLRPDSIRLRASAAGEAGVDTVLRVAGVDTLVAPVLPPGAWRWEATAWGEGGTRRAAGELVIEEYAPELSRPAAPLRQLGAGRALGEAARERGAPVPLHAAAWPWVLVVLLLGAEWVLRRRWGLR